MYKEVFTLRIYARRKELQLSQLDVSNETEINQSNISKYETGKLEPNLETLGKLAEYYQVSTDWLLGNQYNREEGNIIKAALNEFLEEAIKTIEGSIEQNVSREETINMIYYNLQKDHERLIEKYSIK